jgi:acyl-CoA oxidase
MTSIDRLALLDDPQVRAFVPLLYVAWIDGEIEDAEQAAIAERLAGEPWLRPAARHAIASWLERDRPPTPAELQGLRAVLTRAAGNVSLDARRSLVSLGASMAGAASSPESEAAARDVATLLGVDSMTPGSVGLTTSPPAEPRVALDARAMQRALDGQQAEVRTKIRAFLDSPERRAYGLSKEAHRALVRTWMKELEATGLTRLAFPGVTDATPDLRAFMVAFETLALGDLSLLVKLGVQLGLFGGSIYFLGTERHRALLPSVASLALPGCFAMSEVGHGSNVAELETVARYVHATRELELHTPSDSARKDWIGGAANDARMATVFAQLEVDGERHGVHAILVPIRGDDGAPLPGVRLGDCGLKMGLNGVDNGRIWLDHVRVPVANLLDRFASIDASGKYASPIASASKRFFTMLGTLVGGRVCVGSAGVSVAKSALAIAVRYSLARRQFGPAEGDEIPLLTYPSHRRRLLPSLATTYVLHFAFDRLRERFAEVQSAKEPDTRELEAEAAGLKAIATWHATSTVQQCREACGGQGYLAVNRLPDLKADSDVFATFEGDNTVLLQLVGKSLLGRFGKQLGSGGPLGMLRMISRVAASAVVHKNPIETRRTDREHLRDRGFHLAALAHREETLVRTAALRLQKRIRGGAAADAAFLEVQEHILAASRAYVDRLALQWFEERCRAVDDAETRTCLARLGDLHALSLLERDAGWYLEDGYVEPSKARAIRKETEALLGELAPIARSLVDAFGIPDACLAAPIAFFDPARPLDGLT